MTQPKRLLLIAPSRMISTLAFERAAAMARSLGATLRIVAFVHHQILEQAERLNTEPRPANRSPLWPFQQWLSTEASRLASGGLQVCSEALWCERTAANICHYIDEAEVDYVLKDMEEELTMGGRMFSTLDWQLLHESPVPVLFIKCMGRDTSHRIVAAVDVLHDEPEVRQMNRNSIEAARELAQSCVESLHLFSVYDRQAVSVEGGDECRSASLPTYEQARSRFDALADQYSIPVQYRHFVVSVSSSIINAYVSKCHFDILVFAAANYLATDDLSLGRTAQMVLGHPPCSLLALKSREKYVRREALTCDAYAMATN